MSLDCHGALEGVVIVGIMFVVDGEEVKVEVEIHVPRVQLRRLASAL